MGVKPAGWASGAESPEPVAAEAEADQEQLNAAVAGKACDLMFQDLEVARLDGDVVEEDRAEDDPADGQEAEGGTVRSGGERELQRHAKGQDGDRDGRGEPEQCSPVCPHVEEGQEAEKDDDGDGGDERRCEKAAADGRVHLRPGHHSILMEAPRCREEDTPLRFGGHSRSGTGGEGEAPSDLDAAVAEFRCFIQ